MVQIQSEPIVQTRGLTRRFGGAAAVSGLDLQVNRGDIYGLLGLNGAGKTTTLRILLGLLNPSEGEARVLGSPMPGGWARARGRIGAMIEAPAFYPHLSGLKNLELLEGLARGLRGGRGAREALEMVGLAGAAGLAVRKYSMGMQQRLYLAQALLNSPELLILDEPTSNLDPQGILDVRRAIQRLNREEGVTVLLSSHQLSEVEGLCNRVAIMSRGRAIHESAVADLFAMEHSTVEVELDRPADAAARCREIEWCEAVAVADGLLSVRIPRARRAELNSLLHAAGFLISEFRERRPTLEDFFHESVARDVA